MRAILSVRPECSHRCVSLKEFPFKSRANPQARDQNINWANLYETKWFNRIATSTVQEHLLKFLRLRNPGFRNRKPRVFINRHPPPPAPQKPPSRSLRTLPSLYGNVLECTVLWRDLQGQVLGGGMGGFRGGSGWQFMKTWGFLTLWESETVSANRVAAINPPIDDTGVDTEIQYRPRKPHGLAKPCRILSKKEADTEFQHRPHIVDSDIDCGRRFGQRHFRDS